MLNVINENLIFYSSQLLILVPRTTKIALTSACFPKARVLAAAVQTGFIFKWMGKHVTKVSQSLTHSVSLLVFSAALCRVVVIANYSLAKSKEIRNLGNFFAVESEILGFGIKNSAQGIRNPGFQVPLTRILASSTGNPELTV